MGILFSFVGLIADLHDHLPAWVKLDEVEYKVIATISGLTS